MNGLGPWRMHGRDTGRESNCVKKIFERMVTEFSGDHGAEHVQQQVGVQVVQFFVNSKP